MSKELVKVWLKAGAIYSDGVLLFKKVYGAGHPLLHLLKDETKLKSLVLKQSLKAYAKTAAPAALPAVSIVPPEEQKPKFRQEYPFLSDLDCPNELKILAADKITAYHNYVSGHERMFDATTPQEQFAAVKFTVENYIENRRILRELEHYHQNRRVLADHPIFDRVKRLQELSKLKVLDLVKLQKKLNQNVWRIKSELAKKNKPHLDPEREASIKEKEFELSEIQRLLKSYE